VPTCRFSCQHHTAVPPSVETRAPRARERAADKKLFRAIDSRKNIV
jgi:hypothetical protein